MQEVVTDDTQPGALMSIGELARTTGLTVRTIRFYCDEGILESQRSAGGHRMFDADSATQRLLLVRQLRALGLGLDPITNVLQGELSIDEAIAAESARLDIEIKSLTWRRASLQAIETVTPTRRAERLALRPPRRTVAACTIPLSSSGGASSHRYPGAMSTGGWAGTSRSHRLNRPSTSSAPTQSWPPSSPIRKWTM